MLFPNPSHGQDNGYDGEYCAGSGLLLNINDDHNIDDDDGDDDDDDDDDDDSDDNDGDASSDYVEQNPDEEWREIEINSQKFRVSSLGRVQLTNVLVTKRLLHAGYYRIGRVYKYQVHRLVALAFSPNEEAYLEYKKSEDHKNGTNSITNSGSVGEVTKKDQLKMLNDLRRLNLLNYIKKNLEVNIREFDGNELTLNPPIQPGDLVHKSSCLFASILPNWHRLMLWHIRGRWFRAIAFFEDHKNT
ncbi:hypothetical protein RhiirB3_469822 [Rhizophagus irregularis]|nr:hypothetical protein RhiirB3_469822 [Rhizophagus irregularis]